REHPEVRQHDGRVDPDRAARGAGRGTARAGRPAGAHRGRLGVSPGEGRGPVVTYLISCPHRSRYTIGPSFSALIPASICALSPTTMMSKWSGSIYCRATRFTSVAVTAPMRSM